MTTTKTSQRRPHSRVLGVCAAVGVAALALAPLAACGRSIGSGTSGAATSPGPSAGGPGAGGLGAVDGGPGPSQPAGQPGHPTAKPTPTSSPEPGAQIVYFKVTSQPACPVAGSSDAPFTSPGQGITIAWKVTGATGVALSVDDPDFFQRNHTGSYQNYDGTQGSATLSFPCDTSQPTTRHTYTINTIGGGGSRSKTLTVTKPSNP